MFKNNLTFVYSGPDSARVDYAYLYVWDIFDNTEYAYFNIRKNIDDVYSDYEWLYYTYSFKPFGEVMLFDEEYGTSMYYTEFDLESARWKTSIFPLKLNNFLQIFLSNVCLNSIKISQQ